MKLKPYLATGDVARAFNVSNQRIQQLDHLLKPERGPHGRRQYDATIVEQVLAARGNR